MDTPHFYHAATKGLVDNILFENEEQFVAGMNRIAICSLMFPKLSIIAFCLMDNHIHLILWGVKSDVMAFMDSYKHSTEIWLAHHAPDSKGKEWDYDCWLIPNLEDLLQKICYVLRNPTVAGLPVQPACYRWSTCNLMFSQNVCPTGAKRASEISVYQMRKMISSKVSIPDEWLIQPNGMIWPGSYVNYKDAMSKFGNVWRFMNEMSRKNEDAINAEMYSNKVSLADGDIRKIAVTVAESMFGESDPSLLSSEQRVALCLELKSKYGCNLKQLGRVLHINGDELRAVFQGRNK